MHAKLLHSCLTLCNPMDCNLPGSSLHWDFPGKNTGVGCYSLFQGIFPTQGQNLDLLHLLHWQADSLSLVPPGQPFHRFTLVKIEELTTRHCSIFASRQSRLEEGGDMALDTYLVSRKVICIRKTPPVKKSILAYSLPVMRQPEFLGSGIWHSCFSFSIKSSTLSLKHLEIKVN